MNLPLSAHTRLSSSRIRFAVIGGLILPALTAHAASDTWTRTTTGGNWSDTTNWLSGTAFADGIDAVATLSASGTQAVNLDTNVTLGTLAFSTGTYTLSSSNGSVLTLSGTSIPSGTGIPGGMAATPTISGNATITATLAGTQGFIFRSGNRSLFLSGNNTYTGLTTLTDGSLYVQSNTALGASGAGNGMVVSRGDAGQFPQLHLRNNVTLAEDITLRVGYSSATLGATTGGVLVYNDSGTTTLNGALTLTRATNGGTNNINEFGIQNGGTLNITGNITGSVTGTQATGTYTDQNRLNLQSSGATNVINISGVIANGNIGNGGVSVYTTTGSNGIIRLSGDNTYSGRTVHQKGSLLINNTTGSGTGTGAVSVASTAVFGGTGFVKPTGTNGITFASGSIVAPGDLTDSGSAIAAGKTLTFDLGSTTGIASFDAGSAISINLNAAAALPADVSEHLAFIGLITGVSQVTFNSNVVNFSVTGGLLAEGVYTLASFSADNAYTGQWVLGTGLEAYSNVQLIQTANSIQLSISAVPEPSTYAAFAGLVAIGTVVTRRRRRS